MTELLQNGLLLHLEADELAGAGGSIVSEFTDLSGNECHLAATGNQPVIKENAVNGKKSVLFDGTNAPLVYSGALTLKSCFVLCKVNGGFTDYAGIISAVTGHGLLAGLPNTSRLYDFAYDFYEFRINDLIVSPVETWSGGDKVAVHQPEIPPGEWKIIYFSIYRGLVLDGIQLGKDRNFPGRLFNGEIALVASYNRTFDCDEARLNTRSIAFSYQLPIVEKFPVPASRNDEKRYGKKILSDGQRDPVTRIKGGKRRAFSINVGSPLSMEQNRTLEVFYDYACPNKTFVFRDLNIAPPQDTISRFDELREISIRENLNQSGGQVELLESSIPPEYSIPLTQPAMPNETGAPIVYASLLDDSDEVFLDDDDSIFTE